MGRFGSAGIRLGWGLDGFAGRDGRQRSWGIEADLPTTAQGTVELNEVLGDGALPPRPVDPAAA